MGWLNKRGEDIVIPPVIWLALGILVLILMAFWVNRSIHSGANSTSGMTQCEAQSKGAGCFAESAVDQKEEEGFRCINGVLGCNTKSSTPYCCFRMYP